MCCSAMHPLTGLLATNFGSPSGVTTQDHYVRELWRLSGYFSVPIGLIVLGLITFAIVRYRHRPGEDRKPSQFQYHIPLEATYTIIPLVIVAVIFGVMYNAENHVTKVSAKPSVAITVDGFQWGWRFVYHNGHVQIGTGDYNDINNNNDLPVLVMPSNETVQLHVVSLDVVHTFYVKEFLFNRDLIPGINNTFDVNVTKPGLYPGQCNNICGEYHAYMRFLVDVMTPTQYAAWYANQPACSVTTAGVPGTQKGSCSAINAGADFTGYTQAPKG